MRLLHTFNNDRDAHAFSSFLTKEGIDNQLEISTIRDWSKEEYGDINAKLWITEEDSIDLALEWLQVFLTNPNDKRFEAVTPPPTPEAIRNGLPPPHFSRTPLSPPPRAQEQPLGTVTFYIILACSLLFLLTQMTTPIPTNQFPKGVPPTALFGSPVKKALLFDYPLAYQKVDDLVAAYGIDKVTNPQKLPPEGVILLQDAIKTPFWNGFYDKIVDLLKTPSTPITIVAPMFEKIRQGELYRLFTPALLHFDIFHIFFNMIWLLVLGKQMERRMGAVKYIFFILIVALITNLSQYLISGPNFLGFSGVVCGMIGYIWMRQKYAPWEGYELQPITVAFITIFILSLLGIQLTSFILEIRGEESFGPPIANTAHIIGAISGILLAKIRFFTGRIKI